MFRILGLSAGKFEDIEGKSLSHFFQTGKTVDPFELSTPSKPATELPSETPIKPSSSLANQNDNQSSLKWFTASKQDGVDPFDILDEAVLPRTENLDVNIGNEISTKAPDGLNQTSLKWFATTSSNADPFESIEAANLSTSRNIGYDRGIKVPDPGQSNITKFTSTGSGVDPFLVSKLSEINAKHKDPHVDSKYMLGPDKSQPNIKQFASHTTTIDPFEAMDKHSSKTHKQSPKGIKRYLQQSKPAEDPTNNNDISIYQPEIIDLDADILDVDSDYHSSDSEIFPSRSEIRKSELPCSSNISKTGKSCNEVCPVKSTSDGSKNDATSAPGTSEIGICGSVVVSQETENSGKLLQDLISVWDNDSKSSTATTIKTPENVMSENCDSQNEVVGSLVEVHNDHSNDSISFFEAVQLEEKLKQQEKNDGLLGFFDDFSGAKPQKPAATNTCKDDHNMIMASNNTMKRKSEALNFEENILTFEQCKKSRVNQPVARDSVTFTSVQESSTCSDRDLSSGDDRHSMATADSKGAPAEILQPDGNNGDDVDDDICVVWQSQTPGKIAQCI